MTDDDLRAFLTQRGVAFDERPIQHGTQFRCHYRTPGTGQQTNVRMNKELVAALTAQVGITFAIVTTASISIDGARLSGSTSRARRAG